MYFEIWNSSPLTVAAEKAWQAVNTARAQGQQEGEVTSTIALLAWIQSKGLVQYKDIDAACMEGRASNWLNVLLNQGTIERVCKGYYQATGAEVPKIGRLAPEGLWKLCARIVAQRGEIRLVDLCRAVQRGSVRKSLERAIQGGYVALKVPGKPREGYVPTQKALEEFSESVSQ